MKPLASLNPMFLGFTRPNGGEQVEFDCPVCPPDAKHRISAVFSNPIDGQPAWPHHTTTWAREGETFETLTLEPSIHYPGHLHGWVEDGQWIDISEATHAMRLEDGRVVALSPRQVAALRKAGRI